jgi:hypothetical protein
VTDVASKVLKETKRFHQALPELLEIHAGRWIVFLDGEVKGTFDSEDAAYAKAVQRFGKDGGFVVAQIVEVTPTPVSAGVLFGIA